MEPEDVVPLQSEFVQTGFKLYLLDVNSALQVGEADPSMTLAMVVMTRQGVFFLQFQSLRCQWISWTRETGLDFKAWWDLLQDWRWLALWWTKTPLQTRQSRSREDPWPSCWSTSPTPFCSL